MPFCVTPNISGSTRHTFLLSEALLPEDQPEVAEVSSGILEVLHGGICKVMETFTSARSAGQNRGLTVVNSR